MTIESTEHTLGDLPTVAEEYRRLQGLSGPAPHVDDADGSAQEVAIVNEPEGGFGGENYGDDQDKGSRAPFQAERINDDLSDAGQADVRMAAGPVEGDRVDIELGDPVGTEVKGDESTNGGDEGGVSGGEGDADDKPSKGTTGKAAETSTKEKSTPAKKAGS